MRPGLLRKEVLAVVGSLLGKEGSVARAAACAAGSTLNRRTALMGLRVGRSSLSKFLDSARAVRLEEVGGVWGLWVDDCRVPTVELLERVAPLLVSAMEPCESPTGSGRSRAMSLLSRMMDAAMAKVRAVVLVRSACPCAHDVLAAVVVCRQQVSRFVLVIPMEWRKRTFVGLLRRFSGPELVRWSLWTACGWPYRCWR